MFSGIWILTRGGRSHGAEGVEKLREILLFFKILRKTRTKKFLYLKKTPKQYVHFILPPPLKIVENIYGKLMMVFSRRQVVELVKAYAPVNIQDRDGETPLFCAVAQGRPRRIKFCVSSFPSSVGGPSQSIEQVLQCTEQERMQRNPSLSQRLRLVQWIGLVYDAL